MVSARVHAPAPPQTGHASPPARREVRGRWPRLQDPHRSRARGSARLPSVPGAGPYQRAEATSPRQAAVDQPDRRPYRSARVAALLEAAYRHRIAPSAYAVKRHARNSPRSSCAAAKTGMASRAAASSSSARPPGLLRRRMLASSSLARCSARASCAALASAAVSARICSARVISPVPRSVMPSSQSSSNLRGLVSSIRAAARPSRLGSRRVVAPPRPQACVAEPFARLGREPVRARIDQPELGPIPAGLFQVVPDELVRTFGPVRHHGGEGLVQVGAARLRRPGVCGVPDERMVESESARATAEEAGRRQRLERAVERAPDPAARGARCPRA